MLFNSWTFVAFFAAVLPIYYALSARNQNRFLLVASYLFYSLWDPRFLALLGISTIVDYAVGLGLDATDDERRRKRLLYVSLVTNLGILGFFKYFDFFADGAVELLQTLGFRVSPLLIEVVLPVGISFYTFQTLAYTIDIWRREARPTRDLLSFALYVAYFPQLVAGPIERAQRLLPQLERTRTVTREQIGSGVQLILWGYVKKVAIGDSLVMYLDAAFAMDEPMTQWSLWVNVWSSAIQAYADFSGYSDIARGVSRLMGIELMENFRQPFLSSNITEFWRRWHVSLATWLRDYVYIPLGGNRRGEIRQSWNLFATLVLGGLWHGANWTFMGWGAMNGVYLVAHKWMTRGRRIEYDYHPEGLRAWCVFIVKTVITFNLFAISVVVLRSPDIGYAADFMLGLFVPAEGAIDALALPAFRGIVPALVVYGIVTFAIDFGCWANRHETPCPPTMRWWWRGLAYAAGFLLLVLVREDHVETFFYFQF